MSIQVNPLKITCLDYAIRLLGDKPDKTLALEVADAFYNYVIEEDPDFTIVETQDKIFN